MLFEEIWSEDTRVAAVKPRPELGPFFRLSLGCQSRDIAGDPDRIRGHMCNTSTSWRRYAQHWHPHPLGRASYLPSFFPNSAGSVELRLCENSRWSIESPTRLSESHCLGRPKTSAQ